MGREYKCSIAQNSSLQKKRSTGRMYACTSMMSPAVMLSLPVMDLATLHCTERSLLVMVTEPLALDADLGLCR